MFVIMVYDINVERVNKVLKVGRRYLTWVQNSVLEGEISKARFEKMKSDLRKVIEESEDAIQFYILRTTQYMEREHLGIQKGKEEIII